MNIILNSTIMQSCSVCCMDYTKETRSKIKCGYCDYEACKQCVRKYLLMKSNLPHCMKCKNKWDLSFVRKTLNSSFIDKEYKQHRRKILLDIEKSRLPESMNDVEKYLSIKKLEHESESLTDEIKLLSERLLNLKQNKHELTQKLNRYKRGDFSNNQENTNEEKKVFIKGCPINGCRGFLSSKWKCGICSVKVCNKCMEPLDENEEQHECNENNVKSTEMIKRSTKNCPSCAAVIYKISGCDQMWCTQCKVAFSWKTGMKVTGVIHNPHFYEWQKNNYGETTNNPDAQHCGGLQTWWTMNSLIRRLKHREKKFKLGKDFAKLIMNMHQGVAHFAHVELRRVREKMQMHTDNSYLRVKYLANELSENDFSKKIYSRDKTLKKTKYILDIYELYNTVATEVVNEIYFLIREAIHNHENSEQNVETWKSLQEIKINICKELNKISQLRVYCNEQLLKIGKEFKQQVKCFFDFGRTMQYIKFTRNEITDVQRLAYLKPWQFHYDSSNDTVKAKKFKLEGISEYVL